MNVALPDSAFFLPRSTGENSGVDFLGLRQANLDMMTDLIPSINNVTAYIRPFSLLSWVFWKFHALCIEAGIEEPTSGELTTFRERIEVLFTWGARLADCPSIPGRSAEPPGNGDEPLPLTFEDWGRIPSSTSLIAALWYGPASKAGGLGFLLPVSGKPEFFRVVDGGVRLAESLDRLLRADEARYQQLLATLAPVRAREDDARALWELWNPSTVTAAEQDAFRNALHDESAVGDYSSAHGRRSSTLALVRLHLTRAAESLTAEEVRRGMFFAQDAAGRSYEVPEALAPARQRWIVLQMRQLQRLALETFLSWCETKILDGHRDTAVLADVCLQAWRKTDLPPAQAETLADALGQIEETCTSLEDFIAHGRTDDGTDDPFALMDEIQAEFAAGGSALAPLCLYGLLLCASFAGCLPGSAPTLRLGGAARISLRDLRQRFLALGGMPLEEAIRFIIEAMVISQHFAIAVNRFDGRNQRLRLAIEETGLCPLVDAPWAPTVTEDRLPTLLSLAAECGLLEKAPGGRYRIHGAQPRQF